MYDEIKESLQFNKFEFGDFLIAEYTCPFKEKSKGVWTHLDSFVHVLSGKKTWHTRQGSWTASKGQTLYIKKGASIIDQYLEEKFCVLLLFVSDTFISKCIHDLTSNIKNYQINSKIENRAIVISRDLTIDSYFQSILSYFASGLQPPESLLTLKLKELILNILYSDKNFELASYFHYIAKFKNTSITTIMENNFCYNLSINEYAKLCNRSISSFKRDFYKIFEMSPRKWLLTKRLEYASIKLCNSDIQISQIAYDVGFENPSHFSRTFKEKFNLTPIQFRKKCN